MWFGYVPQIKNTNVISARGPPLFSFSLLCDCHHCHPPMVSFVSLPCRAEHFSIVVAAATDLFAVLSAILPTFLLSAPSPKTERIHSHARTDAHKHIHRRVYTRALAYKLLFSETRREQQERKDNVPRSGVAGAVRYGKTQERRMGAGTERFEREGAYVLSSCR